MGKRVHGRLVHEVREALHRAGFMPTRITQLDGRKGPRPVRSPGFRVEKHNDGKSVRLLHIAGGSPAEDMARHSQPSPEHTQMQRLAAYSAALGQEGFTRIAFNSRDHLAPYSLWRRVDENSRAKKRRAIQEWHS